MATEEPVGILIVCGADFRAPSEKQALWLSEALLRAGHRVRMSIAGDLATAESEGATAVAGLEVVTHAAGRRRLDRAAAEAARRFAPDVVYALNARLPVMTSARAYARATGAPVFVHFEDDEWGLRRAPDGTSPQQRAVRHARRAAAVAAPRAWRYATGGTLRWVAEHARGVDALTPALAREVEQRLGRPATVIPPASPRVPPDPLPCALPDGVDGRPVVAYTGAIFDAQALDAALGMGAVAALRAEGRDVLWVHAGPVAPQLDALAMAREQGLDPEAVVLLGYRPYREVLGLLRRADVLVQPGRPTEFNRLRLPSKLQSYLASGRPTVTYATGLDEVLTDREEVLFTRGGEADELAARIGEALDDDALRARLAAGGPAAARRLFDADANAARLVEHFRTGLERGA